MTDLPETILQFGAGNFLRAFVDNFIHQANRAGQGIGTVVVVQSTGAERAALLNKQGGLYHVVIRGIDDGVLVDRVEEVGSISRALYAGRQWAEVLDVARSPALRLILSNTTEVGYNLDPTDRPDASPPASFPAKLLAVLKARFDAGLPGLTLLPCELFEHNADLLRTKVLGLAERWKYSAALLGWVERDCVWLNTLVDRIVPGQPAGHPLLAEDPLLLTAEPYALFAIEERPGAAKLFDHPAIRRSADISPYFLRKVRILNGAHTALVCKARPRGFRTVREAVSDPELSAWLTRLLTEEIVPTLEGRVEDAAGFARQTLDRFRNPFLEHELATIAGNHLAKVAIRLEPTREEFITRFGRRPPLLDDVLADPAAGLRTTL